MNAEGPLAGVRVLDLTRYIPGPYATLLLGDLGADVVKVEEPPVGDPTRVVPPPVGDDSAAHLALNRNKRSVALDWHSDEGALAVRRLAERVDVLVETFRPGVLARRGLGPSQLLEANPRLVYCSITGYGQDGPHAGRAGHDISYLSLAGFLGANRGADGRPVLPPAPVADMTAAYLAVAGILAALVARERTGRGQHVDVSLLRAALATMTFPLTRALAGAEEHRELTGGLACYNVYRCRDGRYLSVGALEPKFWESLCRALGRPDLAARQFERGAAQGESIATLAALFATRDRDDWVRDLAKADACVEPVLDPREVPSVAANAAELIDQPAGDARVRTVGSPLRFSHTPAALRCGAPGLGADTDDVLSEAGFTRDEIERLKQAGTLA